MSHQQQAVITVYLQLLLQPILHHVMASNRGYDKTVRMDRRKYQRAPHFDPIPFIIATVIWTPKVYHKYAFTMAATKPY